MIGTANANSIKIAPRERLPKRELPPPLSIIFYTYQKSCLNSFNFRLNVIFSVIENQVDVYFDF